MPADRNLLTGRRRTGFKALISAPMGSALLSSIAAAREVSCAVDLELVLAVDVPSFMNAAEQHAQRDGYVGALRDPEIWRLIKAGPHGRIAIAYVEWAKPTYQRVPMPWIIVKEPDDARAFAAALADKPISSEGGTSISGGLLMAEIAIGRSRWLTLLALPRWHRISVAIWSNRAMPGTMKFASFTMV